MKRPTKSGMGWCALGASVLLWISPPTARGATWVTTNFFSWTVSDLFGVVAYTNNDGTTNWVNGWTETGDDGLAASGYVSVKAVGVTNILSFAGNLAYDDYVTRAVAFPAGRTYTNATLSFSYRRVEWDTDDSMAIHVSTNGFASQSNLVYAIAGAPAKNTTDAAYTNVTTNITALLGANLSLRVQAGSRFDPADECNFDFVTITCSGYEIVTNSDDSGMAFAKAGSISGEWNGGATNDYYLTIENTGTVTLTGMQLTDALPTGVTFVAGSAAIVQFLESALTSNSFSGTVSDGFGAVSYGNNDGTANWAGGWTEAGDDGLAASGSERVRLAPGTNALVFEGNLADGDSVMRSLFLPAPAGRTYTNATLSFAYLRENWDSTDSMAIEVSTNGFAGQSNLVYAIDGRAGTDAAYSNASVDITAFMGSNLSLRVRAGPNFAPADRINFDFFTIAYSGYDIASNAPTTYYRSNVTVAVVSNLASATPTNLLSNYTLAPGTSISVRVRATLDMPMVATQFVNTATSTNAQTPPLSASVTNFSVANSVGDFVWDDANGNGLQDGGETGLTGVVVRVCGSGSNLLATTTSGVAGAYAFTGLPSGSYVLEFVPPANHSPTAQDQGGDDALDSDIASNGFTSAFTLSGGTNDTGRDAGFYRLASVGDFAWADANANGLQDGGSETGLPGVVVALYNASSNLVATTNTAADGAYSFTNLPCGSYFLVFTALAEYHFSPQNKGADDALDSDVAPFTGRTAPFDLPPGTNDVRWDAGLVENQYGLAVTKTSDATGRLAAGATLTYTMTVENTGTVTQAEIEFYDELPAGLTYVADSVNWTGGTLATAGPPPNLLVNLTLAPAEIAIVTFQATVDAPSAVTQLINTVHSYNPNYPAVPASVTNGVQTADVGIGKSATTNAPEPGQAFEYILVATNSGPDTAAGVEITDLLPAGVDYNSHSNGTFDSGTGVWDIGALEAGASTTLYVLVTVQAEGTAGQHITNTATVTGHDLVDPVPGNDSGSAVVSPPAVTLGDFIWEDLDANGQQDAGEPGLSNVVVTLYNAASNVVGVTTSSAAGAYVFANLPPGGYFAAFEPPTADYLFTAPNSGDDATDSDPLAGTNRTALITLAGGQTNATVDAGFYVLATIGDYTWVDKNLNGQPDGVDVPLSNVVVTLYGAASNAVGVTTTDVNGAYAFADLMPGGYFVAFEPPTTNYWFTAPNVGDDATDSDPLAGTNRTAVVALTSGRVDHTVDAGFFLPPIIGDFIWEDTNGNGQQDAGESALPDVVVTLYDAASNVVGVMTSMDWGLYGFTEIPPGDYFVSFAPPEGYLFTVPNSGDDATDSDPLAGTNRTAIIPVAVGQVNQTVDAGFYLPPSIGDYVWEDLNANGQQDAGEPGLSNVVVTLYDTASNVVEVTTSSVAGVYGFTDLAPGDYVVAFETPAGYLFTTSNSGDDATDSDPLAGTNRTAAITLASGEVNATVDAGFCLPATLGDTTWVDVNKDGQQNGMDVPLPDVVVTLYDAASNVVGVTTSAVDGAYAFTNLPPGGYFVAFAPPADYLFTISNVGSDTTDSDPLKGTNRTAIVTLGNGQVVNTVDAGFFLPPAVGDFIWKDVNGNGQQDAGEPALSNVVVTLYDAASNVVGVTTSSEWGVYGFTDLPPGDYFVAFAPPPGYGFTTANSGDDATDSDPLAGTNRTAVIALASGQDEDTVDAGFYLPVSVGDRVWFDANGNGLQDGGSETGLPDVVVTLYDAASNVVGVATSSAAGAYGFTNLVPGSYFLGFEPSPGYTFTLKDQGGDEAADSDVSPVTGRTARFDLPSGTNDTSRDAGLDLVAVSGLGLTKTSDATGRLAPGATITYTMTVENTGTASMASIVLEDELPSGLTYVSNSVNWTGGTLATAGPPPNLLVNLTLAPAEIATVTFAATVDTPSTVTQLLNTAATYSPSNPVVLASATNGVQFADVGIEKSATTNAPDMMQTIEYMLVATNSGPDTATGVEITDLLPEGVLYNSHSNGAYNSTSGVWTVGSLAAAASTALYVQVTVLADTAGLYITNTATVTARDLADPVPGNDTGSAVIVPKSGAVVGDRVWYDANGDGIQDAGETNGFADVPVALLDAASNVVASTTTAADGLYLFENIVPGTYSLRFDLSAMDTNVVVRSPPHVGGDAAFDSDATGGETGTNAWTDGFTLSSGQTNLDMDVGLRDPPEPTRVVLYSFTVGEENGVVVVRWRTASEENTVGFFVDRLEDGRWVQVNKDIIYAKGEDGFGASYSLVDPDAVPGGTYTYRIIEIETDGQETYGPFERIASALELLSPIASGPDGILIRWLGREGETYQVLRSTNLLEGAKGFQAIASGLPAAPEGNEYLDRDAAPMAMYLIQVDGE